MRIRQIKPAFCRDALMNSLPLETRLFYILLWMEADDSGWMRWDTVEINADLYPYEALGPQIEEWAGQLEAVRRLRRYRCGHAFIPHLTEHQHLAGTTKQVHTFALEHAAHRRNARRVRPNLSASVQARPPAAPRGNPRAELDPELSTNLDGEPRGHPREPAGTRAGKVKVRKGEGKESYKKGNLSARARGSDGVGIPLSDSLGPERTARLEAKMKP